MSIEQFMQKLSAEMELEQPLTAQIPGVYSIPLDEGYSITITSPSSERFDFSSTLGPLPAVANEAFFTQLLLANLFGQGTRGAVLALDGDGNMLMLKRTISHHIEYKEFRDLVEDFINVADYWREQILNPQTSP